MVSRKVLIQVATKKWTRCIEQNGNIVIHVEKDGNNPAVEFGVNKKVLETHLENHYDPNRKNAVIHSKLSNNELTSIIFHMIADPVRVLQKTMNIDIQPIPELDDQIMGP